DLLLQQVLLQGLKLSVNFGFEIAACLTGLPRPLFEFLDPAFVMKSLAFESRGEVGLHSLGNVVESGKSYVGDDNSMGPLCQKASGQQEKSEHREASLHKTKLYAC